MKRFLLSVSIFLFAVPVFSQTENLGSWMTFSIDKDLGKKFGFGVDQEFRLKDNFTTVNLLYTNIGFNYKPVKFIKTALIYRFVYKQKDDGSFGVRNRLMADLSCKFKPGNWTLSYRARFQAEWRAANYHSDYQNVPEAYLRNLFKIEYKAGDHFTPYLATELRWQLQDPRMPWGNGFDRQRIMAGTDYEINKRNKAGLYILTQHEYNVSDPETLYIIGLEYSISID